ncbi:pyrroloquinoline quinone biosynthesis peptide chaperone PqqD [Saccharopolyspora griseoalba]|uniref:Pyrroloquinoline quinone biosynthesis peptide chaperone PqqD n=1 Tax=Saccharopolyspora griseoalba TaxID=1431848 RepID=A0ABW2LMB4_9PSEU
MDPEGAPRLVPKGRLRFDKVRGGDMLLLPERVVELNTSSAAILRLCDGTRTAAEIITELEADFNTSGLSEDVLGFLRDAHRRGWVTT